jgi:two-component system CheB/CheR fusion protein
VLVLRDITDRSLRRLQDEFIATASHELRTPLAVLTGYLHLIDRSGGAPVEHARRALEQAGQLDLLVQELLDTSRLETGQLRLELEPVDLGAIVLRAVDDARMLAPLAAIRYDRPATPVIVNASAARLQQVIRNILDNARVHAASTPSIDVSIRRRGGRADIAIADRGPGIAESEIGHLFERFTRRSDGVGSPGLGLGLYIARQIAQAHGGSIAVDSKGGHGTTFHVRLPLLLERRPTKRSAPRVTRIRRR